MDFLNDIVTDVGGPAPESRLVATVEDDGDFFGRQPVHDSHDLRRILSLPRRKQVQVSKARENPMLEPLRQRLHAKLALPGCDRRLKDLQVWSLVELPVVGGGVVGAGVGHGKTLITLLLPMVMGSTHAILVIPPSARASFQKEWLAESKRWRLPNLTGGKEFYPGRPLLTLITYSELSQPGSSELLGRLQPVPDLAIYDEAHRLKDRKTSTSKRVFRFHNDNPHTRHVFLTGTPASRSVRELAPICGVALGPGSPLPHHYQTVEEWAGALDAPEKRQFQAPPGHLRRFCEGLEGVREGVRRRLVETPGFIATTEGSANSSVTIKQRHIEIPATIRGLLVGMRGEEGTKDKGSWTRPDGEEMITAVQLAESARELAAGFFLRWKYPRGEPRELVDEWFLKRKAWRSELRDRLKHGGPQMDSELLVTNAAIRWHDGYVWDDARGRHEEPPRSRKGPFPVWESTYWLAWRAIRDQVAHVEDEVWVDDFLAKDAAEWGREAPGIIWVHNNTLGERIARYGGIPYYAGGRKASELLVNEKGDRSVVASISAHYMVKNLQVFKRMLFGQLPSSGKIFEQAIGRIHRQGQEDPVEVYLYAHTREYRESLEQAYRDAEFSEQLVGNLQKLNHCALELSWDPRVTD